MNWGAVIGAGASLLGGAMASRGSGKHVVPDYAKIRRKAEAAGFNPLTALTSAPGSAVASQNYMGSAIADAGLILADGMAKKAEKTGELQKAREQNAQLKERVQQLTIRPRVGGIYADNVNTPSIRAAVGGGNAVSSDVPAGLADHSPLAGDPVGTDDLLRTGPQLATARDVPAFRAFGHDFYGSGLFSSGQQIEDSVGEGPVSWVWPFLTVPDALINEGWKASKPWLKSKIGAEVGPERDLTRFPHSSVPHDQRSAFERINDWRKWWER